MRKLLRSSKPASGVPTAIRYLGEAVYHNSEAPQLLSWYEFFLAGLSVMDNRRPSTLLFLIAGYLSQTAVPFRACSLKLVAGPQCPVIEVAGWLTLLNESPRVENSVVGLKPQVTIRLPVHFRAWTMTDETRVALSRRNNQKSGDGIHSVAQVLSPLKYPINGGSQIVRQRRFNMRVYVDKVDGTWACRGEDAKIISLRKQGIERTQRIRSGIVATGDVCLGAETWFQRNRR